MFCLKCGNEIKEGMMFCNRCGSPVDKAIQERLETPVMQSEGKKNPPYILIAMVAVLLIVVFVFIKGKNMIGIDNTDPSGTDSGGTTQEDIYQQILGEWSGSAGKISVREDGIYYDLYPSGWGEFNPSKLSDITIEELSGVDIFTDYNQSIRIQIVPERNKDVMDVILYCDDGYLVETYDPGEWMTIGGVSRN